MTQLREVVEHVGDDPLHTWDSTLTTWSTTNTEEAIPGVTTPFTWSFYSEPIEIGIRAGFHDIGGFPKSRAGVPHAADERLLGIFCGRLAISMDLVRTIGDQMLGSSGDAAEQQYFGVARQGIANNRNLRRIPIVLGKFPPAVWRARRRLAVLDTETTAWWQASVRQPPEGMVEAQVLLRDARDRWAEITRTHSVITMVSGGLFAAVKQLCSSAGQDGLELALVSSGTSKESGLVRDLWALSRDALPLTAFLERWGFHGPVEGELSIPSWRQDPSALLHTATLYRHGQRESPQEQEARTAKERMAAEARLMAALPAVKRPPARLLLKLARTFIPLREVGRSTFLKAFDVARCATAQLADIAVSAGLLDDPSDVYFLTCEELLLPLPPEARERIAFRRERQRVYQGLTLPERWTGQPPVTMTAESKDAADEPVAVTGLGAAAGVVEGVVRVTTDGLADGFEPGEILVARTTDASWSALFVLAAGVVIDVGGAMSHGAIVARELGIPCVIGTRTGTTTLRTGDKVRIDGTLGTVERI